MLVIDGCMNCNYGRDFQLGLKGSNIKTVARVGREIFDFTKKVNKTNDTIRNIMYRIQIEIDESPEYGKDISETSKKTIFSMKIPWGDTESIKENDDR
mmetsp:Transcript_6817/g.8609  ORF Transcript_6817/g.8609 Transcript_6817/m.8609 type:complete len:98 (-) Transcript_6817:64-357(-)